MSVEITPGTAPQAPVAAAGQGPHRIVVLGPQGAGKGTQGSRLAQRQGVPAVSTGDIFRANVGGGTELGRVAKGYMDRGDLVPDEVTVAMVADRLRQPDAAGGFLLDGFPRNRAQAHALAGILDDLGVGLDAVLELTLSDEQIIRRLSGRRVDTRTGRVWHVQTDPPPAELVQQGLVVQRDDDQPGPIARRLEIFHTQTAPLIGYYADAGLLVTVDGNGSVDEVADRVAAALHAA